MLNTYVMVVMQLVCSCKYAPKRTEFCHLYLCTEGVLPSYIDPRIVAKYSENCIAQQKIYEWVEKFKNSHI